MDNVKVLTTVKDLIFNPSDWVKSDLAVNDDFESVEPTDDDACRWCVFGAMDYVAFYYHIPYVQIDKIWDILKQKVNAIGDYADVSVYNDASTVTHSDIIALLDETINDLSCLPVE